MRFTEFVRDYLATHPDIRLTFHEAMRDPQVKCAFHEEKVRRCNEGIVDPPEPRRRQRQRRRSENTDVVVNVNCGQPAQQNQMQRPGQPGPLGAPPVGPRQMPPPAQGPPGGGPPGGGPPPPPPPPQPPVAPPAPPRVLPRSDSVQFQGMRTNQQRMDQLPVENLVSGDRTTWAPGPMSEVTMSDQDIDNFTNDMMDRLNRLRPSVPSDPPVPQPLQNLEPHGFDVPIAAPGMVDAGTQAQQVMPTMSDAIAQAGPQMSDGAAQTEGPIDDVADRARDAADALDMMFNVAAQDERLVTQPDLVNVSQQYSGVINRMQQDTEAAQANLDVLRDELRRAGSVRQDLENSNEELRDNLRQEMQSRHNLNRAYLREYREDRDRYNENMAMAYAELEGRRAQSGGMNDQDREALRREYDRQLDQVREESRRLQDDLKRQAAESSKDAESSELAFRGMQEHYRSEARRMQQDLDRLKDNARMAIEYSMQRAGDREGMLEEDAAALNRRSDAIARRINEIHQEMGAVYSGYIQSLNRAREDANLYGYATDVIVPGFNPETLETVPGQALVYRYPDERTLRDAPYTSSGTQTEEMPEDIPEEIIPTQDNPMRVQNEINRIENEIRARRNDEVLVDDEVVPVVLPNEPMDVDGDNVSELFDEMRALIMNRGVDIQAQLDNAYNNWLRRHGEEDFGAMMRLHREAQTRGRQGTYKFSRAGNRFRVSGFGLEKGIKRKIKK